MKTAERCALISAACDRISLHLGTSISWLSLVMVLLTAAVVLMRLVLGIGSVAAQEAIIYAHATLFMLCLAYNLQQNAHVRVDVFYHRFSAYTRAWINATGAIVFLLPFGLFLFFISFDYVQRAWQIKEGSIDPGGLPLVYLLKSLIPLAGALLVIQAISQVFQGLAVIYAPREIEP